MEPKPVDQQFLGKWIKDKKASDSLDEVSQIMGLNLLKRQAIKLAKGLEIKQDGTDINVGMFSLIDWFKLHERYPLDGSIRKNMRRDLRGGGTKCHLEAPAPDHLLFKAQWDEPYGGEATDDIRIAEDNKLHINSTVTVHGKTITYQQIYRRA